MTDRFSEGEIESIQRDIRKKYDRVALSPEGEFRYPVGIEALEELEYDRELIERLPPEVAGSYCGSGNPFSLGEIETGDRILDFGCGAGVDSILAAYLTGRDGRIIGVDAVPAMVERAKKNAKEATCDNVDFFLPDELNFRDLYSSFDLIITNSVINLIPEKEDILATLYNLLKPGGRLHIVDQIFNGSTLKEHSKRVESWFQ